MQPQIHAAAAALALSLLPATSLANAQAAPQSVPVFDQAGAEKRASQLEEKLAHSIADLRALVQKGEPIQAKLEELRKALQQAKPEPYDPQQFTSRTMAAAVEKMEDRAKSNHVTTDDVDELKGEIFWARVDEVVLMASYSAQRAGSNIRDFESRASAITGGTCTVFYPHSGQRYQQRIGQALDLAVLDSASPQEMEKHVRHSLIEDRLERARAFLAQRLKHSTQVRGDYEMIYRLLRARVELLKV